MVIFLEVVYSIPIKVIANNGTLKCTIPSKIAKILKLNRSDMILWILRTDGSVEIKKHPKLENMKENE